MDSTSATGSTDTGDVEPLGIVEDFESYQPGSFPGPPWQDIAQRIDAPTVAAPTAVVTELESADGSTTNALRTLDAIGTSQGAFALVKADVGLHRLEVDVRVDRFSDAVGVTKWPIAVGFSQEGSASDLNSNPHAVVYPYTDGRWYLFVFQNSKPGINMVIPEVGVDLGHWYRVVVEIEPETQTYRAAIVDAVSDETLGQRIEVLDTVDPALARYDAVAFYDGEYEVSGGVHGGVAAIDNVVYSASLRSE